MGKSTISMAIFNSKLLVYERVKRKITYFERSPPTEILSDRYSDILQYLAFFAFFLTFYLASILTSSLACRVRPRARSCTSKSRCQKTSVAICRTSATWSSSLWPWKRWWRWSIRKPCKAWWMPRPSKAPMPRFLPPDERQAVDLNHPKRGGFTGGVLFSGHMEDFCAKVSQLQVYFSCLGRPQTDATAIITPCLPKDGSSTKDLEESRIWSEVWKPMDIHGPFLARWWRYKLWSWIY